MSKELLKRVIDKGVEGNLNVFFQDASKYYSELDDDLSEHNSDQFAGFRAIGEINFSPQEKLVVVTAEVEGDLTERSGKKSQYEKAKKILKQYRRYDAGIFVFSDVNGNFRLSLVYGTPDAARLVWSNFRRFTYFVSRDQTYKTFLDRIGTCSFSSLDIVKDAFSVEKVNKEFYKEIAKYYYRLTGKNEYKRELVLPSVGEGDDRKYEEFAVRLIGRVIFCWFLKHKKSAGGIPLIPTEALSVSAVQNHKNYYHSILEPLFFEVMNKPVKDRKSLSMPESDKIPFLNGGLFEPHSNDFYKPSLINVLKIPDAWFVDFLRVLEQYNFTIDENSTVDADVSVDPEMLGRIFENLLAEVNPETGETARKATGSYYTPRVIVDYMVEQSLKQYLLTRTALAEDEVNHLLSYEEDSINLEDDARNAVVTALKEIKVIDPACGSGAFPMGILHRVLLVLEKVDPKLETWRKQYLDSLDPMVRQMVEKNIRRENWVYIRKLLIIRDSIYGVDIQPIAVDIAKLRCFLSLIVDELVLDNEENRGIEPLPNLEFKFVAANTLIGLPPKAERQGTFNVSGTVERLRELRESYLRSYGKEKESIEKDFRATQQKLFNENIKWGLSDTRVKQLIEWDPFSYKSCGWFDPEWMFGITDGFDVVIANPPYVDSEAMVKEQPDLRQKYSEIYSTAKGNWDLYVPFLELGYDLLTGSGVASFITPNKWYAIGYGKEIRKKLTPHIHRIANCNLVEVFEAGNSPVVTIFRGNNSVEKIVVDKFDEDYSIVQSLGIERNLLASNLGLALANSLSTVLSIQGQEKTIGDYYDAENPCSVAEAYEIQEIIEELSDRDHVDQPYFRFVNTGTIEPFLTLWGKKNTTYLKVKYHRPIISKAKFKNLFPRRYEQTIKPKLVISGMRHFESFIDEEGQYIAGKSTEILFQKTKLSLKLALAILNSKLIRFYIKQAYSVLGIDGGINFTTDLIEGLPIPKLEKTSEQKTFVEVIDKILAITKAADYFENKEKQAKVKEYERQIDQLVYQFYRLTPDEIAVVEGSVKG